MNKLDTNKLSAKIKANRDYKISSKGWIDSNDPPYTGFTLFFVYSEPNGPNVLECRDKMMNEI